MENTELLGKYLLIGITLLDGSDNVIDQYQTHGRIVSIDDRGIVIEKADGTGSYTLPPDISNLHAAEPGEYLLRTTDESCGS